MINRRAIFTDETSTFKTPYEPMPGDTVTLRLRTLRNDILRAYAVVNGIRRSMTKQPSHFEDEFDFYSVSFVCSEKCVKYYFELFDEDDKVAYNRLGCVENAQPEYNFSFLPGFKVPDWAKSTVFYQIFPDRFCNGNSKNDVEDNESEEEREARLAAISSAPKLENNQRYNRSFTARLIQSSDTVKEWYAMIKDAALSYKGTRSSSAWRQEKIYKGRALFVKLAIRGRTLCVYFPLNVGEVKNIEVEDVSDKPVHAATPALFRIKKDVHARQALELVAMSAEALGLEAGKAHVTDKSEYALQTTEQLIEAGLVKLVTVKK